MRSSFEVQFSVLYGYISIELGATCYTQTGSYTDYHTMPNLNITNEVRVVIYKNTYGQGGFENYL